MDQSAKALLRREMMAAIMAAEQDPGRWLLAVRAICERSRLAPERCIPLGGEMTLEAICFRVLEEAGRQARTPEAMRASFPG